jgi:hypothetical protein
VSLSLLHQLVGSLTQIGKGMTHKLFVILAISTLHIIVIFSLSTQKKSKMNRSAEQVIILNLFQPKTPKNYNDDKLITGLLRINKLDIKTQISEINLREFLVEGDDNPASTNFMPYDKVKRAFDFRLQDKFQENNSIPIDPNRSSVNSWTSLDGTQFLEVDDGECITSMPKLPNTGRGTNWSSTRVKCGKSESERMMENVERGLRRKK